MTDIIIEAVAVGAVLTTVWLLIMYAWDPRP